MHTACYLILFWWTSHDFVPSTSHIFSYFYLKKNRIPKRNVKMLSDDIIYPKQMDPLDTLFDDKYE